MVPTYPGEKGLILITIVTLATAVIFACEGDWLGALASIAGIVVGWWAVEAINK